MFVYIPYSQKDTFKQAFPNAKFNKEQKKWELTALDDVDRLEKDYCHSIPYDNKAYAKESGGLWIPEFKKWLFVESRQYDCYEKKVETCGIHKLERNTSMEYNAQMK